MRRTWPGRDRRLRCRQWLYRQDERYRASGVKSALRGAVPAGRRRGSPSHDLRSRGGKLDAIYKARSIAGNVANACRFSRRSCPELQHDARSDIAGSSGNCFIVDEKLVGLDTDGGRKRLGADRIDNDRAHGFRYPGGQALADLARPALFLAPGFRQCSSFSPTRS